MSNRDFKKKKKKMSNRDFKKKKKKCLTEIF